MRSSHDFICVDQTTLISLIFIIVIINTIDDKVPTFGCNDRIELFSVLSVTSQELLIKLLTNQQLSIFLGLFVSLVIRDESEAQLLNTLLAEQVRLSLVRLDLVASSLGAHHN